MTQTIAGISSMATRQILRELALRFEAEAGFAVAIEAMGGVPAADKVRSGIATDIVILASGPMAKLETEGHLLPGSVVPFARSGMAIAVAAGAARPEIGEAEDVRRAILAAKAVGYSTGPSGDHLLKLCGCWGFDEAAMGRLVKAPAGTPVATLVARGEAELGFQQLSEFAGVDGIDIVGPLPPAIQATTVFAAGIAQTSVQPDAVRQFLAFLNAADADAVKRKHGMEPA